MIMKRATLLAALLSLTFSIQADDWLQFRGPEGTGISADDSLPAKLNRESIAYEVSLPGRGLSSPIVVGDKLFLTASSGPDQEQLHILCLSVKDGSLIWERRFWATGRTMTHQKTCVAAPTPASDGKRIFALYSCNDLFCLDLEGNLVWLRGLTQDYPNASNSLGMSSSVAVVDGTVVVQIENDSQSLALGIDALSGLNRWMHERPKGANWTSPMIMKYKDGAVALLQSKDGVNAVDVKSGEESFYYADGAATIPSGAVSCGVIFAVSRGITAMKPTGDGRVEQLWRSGMFRPGTASPIVMDGRIFTVNNAGVLSVGSVEDGKRLWQLRMKGPFSASPVSSGKRLYFVNEKGLVQVVDTSTGDEEGKILSSLDLKDTVLGTPAVADGALFIRSDKRLWRIDG